MIVDLKLYEEIKKSGIDLILSLPCILLKGLLTLIDEKKEIQHIPITREEEGVGIAAGAYLGGKTPAILMQNSGLGNSVNAIGEADNTWDDGYPSGGNSWDDYNGTDGNMDGIGDTPYHFEDSSVDYYPLMDPYGSVKILPTSYTIIRGNHIAGDLGDIYHSDDSRLTVNAGLTMMTGEPPVWIRLEGTVPSATPDWLEFTLEARAIGGSIVQKIELYNYETGSYEEIDERIATSTDSVVEVYVSGDLSRFVDPDTLEMIAYLKWKPSGPLFVWPFTVGIDQSIWTIY